RAGGGTRGAEARRRGGGAPRPRRGVHGPPPPARASPGPPGPRRDPISDLEGAHRVVTACHLANLSLRLGRKLRWDSGRETVVGDPEAQALLERPYRAHWDAERKALIGTG